MYPCHYLENYGRTGTRDCVESSLVGRNVETLEEN